MKKFYWTTKRDFIEFYIDLFQLLYFAQEKNRVRDREREFLIHLVIMNNEGWDLSSRKSVRELKNRMKFTKRDDVYTYRTKLKKKNLLQQTKDGLVLPGFLRLKSIKSSMKVAFEIVNTFPDAVGQQVK